MSQLEQQPSFKRLAKVYSEKTKRLVIFCGAGASRECGLPTWDELVVRIKDSYLDIAKTDIGHKLADELNSQIKSLPVNWHRMSRLKEIMGEHFEVAVRNNLNVDSNFIPTFYKEVWKLEPNALLSFNLDNFANTSYVQRKTGRLQNHLLGIDAPNSRISLGDGRPLIVDLHGNVDTPRSWILTNEERENLLEQESYLEFLKSMFAHNLVLFYGVSVDDLTVSGQLSYLRKVGFVTGDYFLIKKQQSKEDLNLIKQLPLNIVYTGEDKSWEEGFRELVLTLTKSRSPEEKVDPVFSVKAPEDDIPSPNEIVKLEPDTIRKHLSAATKKFYQENGEFDYVAYRNFCKLYDTAIHISTRVNPNDANQYWLGNRIQAELGRGNFGRVYQAFDASDNSIAVKVAHMEVRDDDAMLNSFRRGVDSMRFLSQSGIRGIVKILDASELPPSIIMEYVQGIDLHKYINDGLARSALDKLNICLWIAKIIFECHSHERIILHRDLRPSNIMITGEYWEGVTENDIRVLDFDLSWFKGASGAEFYMNASQALGFLAPEQIDAKSRYSNRSALVDVYGIAMLLYFMVSGEIPLANASSRVDWGARLKAASANLFSKNWRSTKYLFEDLVFRATSEVQTNRPKLPDFIDSLKILVGICEGVYPFDADSVIIEILSRISPSVSNANFDMNMRMATYTSPAGTSLEMHTDGRVITCVLRHTLKETSNRVTRGRDLSDALFKAKSKAMTFAHVDENFTGTVHGGNQLKFTFEVPTSLRSLEAAASGIDFAVVEIKKS
ncbi:protein kinase domain-containing protein [Gellertiella hungarica]|uniref:Serine/threonine protein kinase n=1 Tax=Gellertiella hungarica TaxID=1572859 RepID=A0A7W6J4A4_9HYPH|nr:protein kinase [Gellertiella hungarica]MBB4064544.1 serine/threonine protein kinase [Gellertiella hungarica]